MDEEIGTIIVVGASWSEAYAFPSLDAATPAYNTIVEMVRAADPHNLSVYRLKLNRQALVVIVGDGLPSPEYQHRCRAACRAGSPYELPAEVAAALLERSLNTWQKQPGFIERKGINEIME